MYRFLEISNHTLFAYYLLSNLIYLFLVLTAIHVNTEHQRRMANVRLERIRSSPLTPPISLLVPARNEEKTIATSVQSLLTLDYPRLEVVVINDGSTDGTLDELRRTFHLRAASLLYIPEIPCAPVRGIYVSSTDGRLIVVDKESIRSKADAINAGLNAASSPYICVVDADAILERDALLRIMPAILVDTERVIAAGGIVRAANGCEIVGGELRAVRLARRPLEILQVIEYLRAFLIGREAWAHFNLLLIISGAFGIFRRDSVREVGGYRTGTVGEDFDLVVRLHRHQRELGLDYEIAFVPDPVCWTEVPPDTTSLGRQRARWQKGLVEVLWRNRGMLFRARYGRIAWVALPYHWVFEVLAPVVELVGYSTLLLAALLGSLSRQFFVEFLIFGYAFATLISMGAVLQEEITFRRYNRWQDVLRLICFCFFEHFPYRQMQMYWRLKGILQYLRGDESWGKLQRVGFPTTS